MGVIVGIDLGTTNSVIAFLKGGCPEVVPCEGFGLLPSVVAFEEDGGVSVGEKARVLAELNPEGTVFSVKRRMGRRTYKEALPEKEVIRQIKRKMGSADMISIRGRDFTPEEISALILRKIRVEAEKYIGDKIEKAVVSVPAYFNISQRRATISAGSLAGLDVIRLVDEPTAAAIAYGIDLEDAHTVLVWDLGGGTFDVSILELGGGVFEVKCVNGDTRLGGDDFDRRIMDYAAGNFIERYGIDVTCHRASMIRLREACEEAKKLLSEKESAHVRIPHPVEDGYLETVITGKKFEELTADLLERMAEVTMAAIKDGGLRFSDIDRVLLVGGATRMPHVRRIFEEITGKEPYSGIDPDKAVAMGAAIQAGILTGAIKNKVLVDVTPISLGIETEGGIFARLIGRNNPVPVKASRLFTNSEDGQTSMEIHLLQGESPLARHNITLERSELTGITPGPRGSSMVEVTFGIDANGILDVSAADLRSDKRESMKIDPRLYGLEAGEAETLAREARLRSEADATEHDLIRLTIKAKNLLHSTMELMGGPADERFPGWSRQLEEQLLEAKKVLKDGNQLRLKKKTAELEGLISAVERDLKPGDSPPHVGV